MSKTRKVITELNEKISSPLREKQTRQTLYDKSMVEWRHINWRKLEKCIYKLQKRIYKASARGDVKTVRRLHSYADEIRECKVSRGQTGYTRQPRSQDGWCGWCKIANPKATTRPSCQIKDGVKGQTYQACMDSKTW